jgi:hypothetical protein
MIELNKGDKLFTDETLSVFEGGVFEEHELVLVVKMARKYLTFNIKHFLLKQEKMHNDR